MKFRTKAFDFDQTCHCCAVLLGWNYGSELDYHMSVHASFGWKFLVMNQYCMSLVR